MKQFPLNYTTISVCFVVNYIAYYFLLNDNFLHISIASLIATSQHLHGTEHMLLLGFLPVYIATMVFGAGLLGFYIGKRLDHHLIRPNKK